MKVRHEFEHAVDVASWAKANEIAICDVEVVECLVDEDYAKKDATNYIASVLGHQDFEVLYAAYEEADSNNPSHASCYFSVVVELRDEDDWAKLSKDLDGEFDDE